MNYCPDITIAYVDCRFVDALDTIVLVHKEPQARPAQSDRTSDDTLRNQGNDRRQLKVHYQTEAVVYLVEFCGSFCTQRLNELGQVALTQV